MNEFGSVSIKGGYYGSSPGATAAIYVNGCSGSINIDNGQFVMGLDPGPMGIYIVNSKGVVVNRPQILECGSYPVAIDNSSFCDVRPLIKNYNVSVGGSPVTMFNTCERNHIVPIFISKANASGYGVLAVGAGHNYNHFDVTAIAPASVTGSKLNINGVNIVATGLAGTNMVSGVIA